MRRQYEFVLDNFAYAKRAEEYAMNEFEHEFRSFPGALYHESIAIQKSDMVWIINTIDVRF